MLLEGLALRRGSVVWKSLALVSGGSTGRISGCTPETPCLGRKVSVGQNSWLLARLPDGALHQSGAVQAGEDSCTLSDPLPVADGDLITGDCLWRLYTDSEPPLRLKVTAIEPKSGRHVRVSAVDFDPRYYESATSDLTAPIPTTRFQPASIISVFFSEKLITAGRGYAIEVQLSLAVAGNWRGAEVLVDGNTVATIASGSTYAAWIESEKRTITVTVVPGSTAAPAGQPHIATSDIEGASAKPPTPTKFLLDVLGDGTRSFRWTEPSDQAIIGYVLRYGATADNLTLDKAEVLTKGLVTESPFEINRPGAGRWSFALTTKSSSGVESDAVWIHADLPRERLGNRVHWVCPSAQGWPGTIAGGAVSRDSLLALESSGSYIWANLNTWSEWTGWTLGDGNDSMLETTYTHTKITLPAELDFVMVYEASATGDVTFEYQADSAIGGDVWIAYSK